MDSPSPGPANSSKMPSKHQRQSHWSSPSSPKHLPGNEHPGSSFQSECLRTHKHVFRYTCVSCLCFRISSVISWDQKPATCSENLWSLTYTAHPGGVEFKVRRAVTVVASRDVDTHPINTDSRVCTFIDVWERRQSKHCINYIHLHKNMSFSFSCQQVICHSSLETSSDFSSGEMTSVHLLTAVAPLFQIEFAHWGINRASLGQATGLTCWLVLPVQLPPLLSSS